MHEADIRAGRVRPDMSFEQKVWAMTARVPRGRVTTYGEIARALGTRSYRAVGAALGRNPYAPTVPCHRVVGSDGRLTGFAGGLDKKRQLLMGEGVPCGRNGKLDPGIAFFRFPQTRIPGSAVPATKPASRLRNRQAAGA
jgi:O-6-methylguanine DNA methyltransferase